MNKLKYLITKLGQEYYGFIDERLSTSERLVLRNPSYPMMGVNPETGTPENFLVPASLTEKAKLVFEVSELRLIAHDTDEESTPFHYYLDASEIRQKNHAAIFGYKLEEEPKIVVPTAAQVQTIKQTKSK